MMDFDEIMGTPHMIAPAERCGRLLFAWFVAVEVLKATINQIDSRLGQPQTEWFEIRNGDKHFFSDNRVIERFRKLCKEGGDKPWFPSHKGIVNHLCAARKARNDIAHRLGPELTEYLAKNRNKLLAKYSEEDLFSGVWGKPVAKEMMERIVSRERAIQKACDSVKDFATPFR